MPETLKEQVERWAGDQFVAWFNDRHATHYVFHGHASPPEADLIYADGSAMLPVEVTGAYYDEDAAKFEWMNARERPDSPDGWSSLKGDGCVVAVDVALEQFLNQRLNEKAAKMYRTPPALVVHHICRILGSDSLVRVLRRVQIPREHSFSGIYFLADLPNDDPRGATWVWELMATSAA